MAPSPPRRKSASVFSREAEKGEMGSAATDPAMTARDEHAVGHNYGQAILPNPSTGDDSLEAAAGVAAEVREQQPAAGPRASNEQGEDGDGNSSLGTDSIC